MNNTAKILVIDDEEVVRHCLVRALKGDHCQVETAGSGQLGLNALEQQAFDVVLLDMRMPGLDGVDVLRAIKQRWPGTEVIVVTGYPTLEAAKQAIRLGAYDYLAKPVGPDEVVSAANDAVQHKRWAPRLAEAA